jgi:FAD synthase
MTIGGFDGIHRGHELLLERILAQEEGEPTVITFLRSPKALLRPADYPGDICTLAQKLEIFGARGIVHTVLIDFSRNFSKLSGRDFIEFLVKRGRLRRLVVGANFRCGYRMDTGIDQIRELLRGIPVEVIESLMYGTAPVSSSRIRTAIRKGDLALASGLLGRPFELDLSGLRPDREGELKSYGLDGQGILTPPPGPYAALVRSAGAAGTFTEIRAEIRIDPERVLVPSSFDAARIEFLQGTQGV